jgi:hypothetical protein
MGFLSPKHKDEILQCWFSTFTDSRTGETAVGFPGTDTASVSLCTYSGIINKLYISNYY